jgi:hypothetical protein
MATGAVLAIFRKYYARAEGEVQAWDEAQVRAALRRASAAAAATCCCLPPPSPRRPKP